MKWPPVLRSMSVVLLAAVSAAAQAPQTVWDGVYTREQASRGEKLYRQECGRCHGDDLSGIESAPALTGSNFAATWDGVPLSDLLERMRVSMPQDKPGSLSRTQNADILAYMLQVSGFPAGDTPLAAQATVLSQITLRTYRPQ
jgi:S-disulfanyl-L-cysteine oxidoreductase SoxD